MKGGLAWRSAVALSLLLACSGSTHEVERVGIYYLQSERLSGAETVNGYGSANVGVLVTIDVKGHVIDARVGDNFYKLDPKPALEAARKWTFKPQSFDGHPVQAVGFITINYEAAETAPDPKVPFPEGSPQDTEVTLRRTACYGSCPDYEVSIRGDGRVRFSSNYPRFPGSAADVHRAFNGYNVLWPDPHETNVEPEAAAALFQKFRDAHFMGMKPDYTAGVTDSPTYELTLRVGTTSKVVVDYVGRSVGMPRSMTQLEDAVDTLAQTDRWIRGNGGTVALLKQQRFDFTSQAGADLVQSAIRLAQASLGRNDPTDLVRAALASGVRLDALIKAGPQDNSPSSLALGVLIAEFAAERGDQQLFDRMAKQGYVSRIPKPRLTALLAEGVGCNATIARALVNAGADPKGQDNDGNALHIFRGTYGACGKASSRDRAAMARTLITLGVPLEGRDSLDWTPLMGTSDLAVTKVLIEAGAKLDAKSNDGTTPVLSVDDDRIALTMLRAGANPRVKDPDGTLLAAAKRRHWPATLEWLAAHGIQ
ncbi:DUF6438 domain-containing protein [Novosphingobium sp. ST904]|uniref:DUF6438 domain-containing protein n=1 Tax=Novosphingobium sp. ST904 TaxID=1684385 RepID=UPI000B2C1FC2|nr:DUF6438 domain-containing protein [Novosphingobium sp. ST904]TCM37047.1 ankyrin repeat protein [Novosphingobium sp. ST904]